MSRTIADLTPGVGVWVYETVSDITAPEEYIYLGLDESGNARLLRKFAAIQKRMHSSNAASYNNCEADIWLENTFIQRFDEATQAALQNTTITYMDYTKSADGTVQYLSIARKIFLPSYYEMGFGGSEGGTNFLPALQTFYNTTNANTARITWSSSGADVNAWLRSAYSAAQFRSVNASGTAITINASYASSWLRPALSVAPATSVSDEGADEIMLLPDGHPMYRQISMSCSLGKTALRPERCKLFLPTNLSAASEATLQLQVCNNYGDTAPTWVNCENGGTAEFGIAKTATDWELGVKAYVEAGSSGESIGEPAMIVAFEGA